MYKHAHFAPALPAARRPDTPAVFAVEIRRWAAEDGSGSIVEAELDPDYRLTAADPDHRSTGADFARAKPKRTNYPAGMLNSRIPGPLATNPDALSRQLTASDPLPGGPQSTLRAIDDVFTSRAVSLPVRAAALRVLAGVPGIAYHPTAADRLGRTGVVVSLDGGNLQYSLIVDPGTGQLLASEQRLIGPRYYLSVPADLVTYYTLVVDQGLRAQTAGAAGAFDTAAVSGTGTDLAAEQVMPH